MSIDDDEATSDQKPTEQAPGLGKNTYERWRLFLDSRVLVALVTVLIGGLFGQCISASIQNSLKEREFQQAWLKARGDQALQSHKEYLEKEQEMVLSAYDLIGKCLTAGRDLIDLTDTAWALERFNGRDREKVADARIEMLNNHSAVIEKWDSESHKIGLLMGYFHPGHPEVKTAWEETQRSVNSYMDCAGQWHEKYVRKPLDTKSACQEKRDEVEKQLTVIGSKLETARQYSWEGWESPEKLREILNHK